MTTLSDTGSVMFDAMFYFFESSKKFPQESKKGNPGKKFTPRRKKGKFSKFSAST